MIILLKTLLALKLLLITILLIPGSIPFIIYSISLLIKKCIGETELELMV
jgi:hypothetical protein